MDPLDDVAEQAMWACALRGNEEVHANLSRICNMLVAAMELTSGAMLSMACDVLANGCVLPCYLWDQYAGDDVNGVI